MQGRPDCLTKRHLASALALGVVAISLGWPLSGGALATDQQGQVGMVHGRVGTYGWRMFVRRSEKTSTRKRPCIGVELDMQRVVAAGAGAPQVVCGPVVPAPNILGYSVGSGQREKSVLALAASLATRYVMLDVGARGRRLVRTHALSGYKARRANVERFGFMGVAFSGRACIREIRTYDARMELEWQSARLPCRG